MNFKFLKATVLLLIGSIPVFAQTTATTGHSHEIGIQTDNDSYLAQGSDQYYTNGIFIHYRQALTIPHSGTSGLANKILGIELGQKMYNPQTGAIPDKAFIDRPFAAYLYLGANLNLLYHNESNLKLGVQTGVIGPAALGAEAQNLIHKTFGFYTLQGWHYQIRNSFQLNLSGEYNRLLARINWFDVSGNSYANVGTSITGAGIGPLLRFGRFNPLYNSVSTQSTAGGAAYSALQKTEIFAYSKTLYNYTAYDATVQGDLFKHNPGDEVTGNPERSVISEQIGVALATKRWVVDAATIFHTRDVHGMVRTHQWGSLTVLYRFL